MTKHIVLISCLGVLAVGMASAQAGSVPDWFLSLSTTDPALLVGRGMAERTATPAEAPAQAKREAMRDLAMSLVCRLSAQIEDMQSDAPGAESPPTPARCD